MYKRATVYIYMGASTNRKNHLFIESIYAVYH